MHTEEGFGNYCRERDVIEDICEVSSNIRVPELALTFRVETIDLGDCPGLVVAAQKCDAAGVLQFQKGQQGHCFNATGTSVHVVT